MLSNGGDFVAFESSLCNTVEVLHVARYLLFDMTQVSPIQSFICTHSTALLPAPPNVSTRSFNLGPVHHFAIDSFLFFEPF